MKRRDFIIQTGSVFSAALLLPPATAGASTSDESKSNKRRSDPDDFQQPIVKAISIGMNAPNPHNTQAWKFDLISDSEALFFVDESRLLTATDPTSRQMHIGCGCFLETLKLGASTLGLMAEITPLPQGTYTLAETGLKPVAHIKVSASKAAPLPLSQHLFSRQTNRSFYQGDTLSDGEFDTLIESCTPKHVQVICKNDPAALPELIDILYEGMNIEAHAYKRYDESRKWFRSSQSAIESHRDGINLRADGTQGLRLKLMEFVVDENKPKSWHKANAINAFLKGYRERMKSAKGVILFKTETNTLEDWIKTGKDYVRFQLAAWALGFVIHPTSQVLQEYPEMDTLRAQFNKKMGCEAPAKIQMAVRIGRGKELYYSYRRHPQDLLLTSTP